VLLGILLGFISGLFGFFLGFLSLLFGLLSKSCCLFRVSNFLLLSFLVFLKLLLLFLSFLQGSFGSSLIGLSSMLFLGGLGELKGLLSLSLIISSFSLFSGLFLL
jgi:hypothetical protein